MTADLTPVEYVARRRLWLKRDDLYEFAGVRGGKVRTCRVLAAGAAGLTTAGSRASPQVNIVAHVARALGVPCRVHVPAAAGPLPPELAAAAAAGATIVGDRPGYNGVIIARSREDAAGRPGWVDIPFGMECREAVEQTAAQVANLPADAERLVIAAGSGMSLAGILTGLSRAGRLDRLPVLAVMVGADPRPRLAKYAPGLASGVAWVRPPEDYHQAAPDTWLGGVELDPIYEAKALRYLRPGDVFWLVGIRQQRAGIAPAPPRPAAQPGDIAPVWKASAKWLSRRIACTPEAIPTTCRGACCRGTTYWPSRAAPDAQANGCVWLGRAGCTLSEADKPVVCLLYPLVLNRAGTLIVHFRGQAPGGTCRPAVGSGPPIVVALRPHLGALFGDLVADALVASVLAGHDYQFRPPAAVLAALARERAWEAARAIPLPRAAADAGVQTLAMLPDGYRWRGRGSLALPVVERS